MLMYPVLFKEFKNMWNLKDRQNIGRKENSDGYTFNGVMSQ
jgi:hypothetical protein